MRKNCSSDGEKLLKFEAEGREFANFLRSLEQFFLTAGQNNFGNKIPFILGKRKRGKTKAKTSELKMMQRIKKHPEM